MSDVKIVNSNNNTILVIQGQEFRITNNDVESLLYQLNQHILRKEALK